MAQNYYYDFGPEGGGVQPIADPSGIPQSRLLIQTGNGFQSVRDANAVQASNNPQFDDLLKQLQERGMISGGNLPGNSFKTGANEGWIVDWNSAPGQFEAQQAATLNPAGFNGSYVPPSNYSPTISNARYVNDWDAELKKANNGGFFIDNPWAAPLFAVGGGMLGEAMLGAGSGMSAGAGATAEGQSLASLAADGLGGYAPAGFGTEAAAGSGAMDWTDLLGDYSSWGNYGDSAVSGATDLEAMAQQLFNNAGTPGFDQYGNDATGLDWITSQFGGPGSTTSTATNALKTLLGGSSGGGTDWMKLLGSLGASGLGAYASNKQTTALEDQAKRYEGYGAPYRQKLSDLYANPTSFLSSKEVTVPVDQGTQSLMRSLSMTGNPFGSGNALQQGQSYASDQLFGKLGQEKDRLAGFGGLSAYNAAAPTAATNAIGSSANAYNAIGSGLGNIFNPPQTTAQTMAEFMKAMKG